MMTLILRALLAATVLGQFALSALGSDPLSSPDLDTEAGWKDYAPCGPTSLYLVCRLKDRPVAWEDVVRALGPPDEHGMHTFADLCAAAKKLDVTAVALQTTAVGCGSLPVPAIIQTEGFLGSELPHLSVLVGRNAEGVFLLDAPFPMQFFSWEQLAHIWTGKAVVFVKDDQQARLLVDQFNVPRGSYAVLLGCALVSFALSLAARPRHSVKAGLTQTHSDNSSLALIHTESIQPSHQQKPSGCSNYWAIRSAGVATLIGCIVTVSVLSSYELRAQSGRLVLETPELDLGILPIGSQLISVPIRNEGDADSQITLVRSGCSCAVAKPPGIIAPGGCENLQIELHVGPGPRSAALLIYSNDRDGPKSLNIKWQGSARVQAVPPCICEMNVPESKPYERVVRLVFPAGGKNVIAPKYERLRCDNPSIEITTGDVNLTAYQFSYTSTPYNVLGALDVKVKVHPPTKRATVDSLSYITLQYGSETQEICLPVYVKFVAGLRVDSDYIAFSADRDGTNSLPWRRLCIKRNLAAGLPHIGKCPDWISCQLQETSAERVDLVMQMTRTPGPGLTEDELMLRSGKDSTDDICLRVLAYVGKKN